VTAPDTTGADVPMRATVAAATVAAAPPIAGTAPQSAGVAQQAGPAGRTGLSDVCDVLWPPPATTSLARTPAAAAGMREFIVLPLARRPRLLVPAGRRASAAAVRRYGEPGSFVTWAGARILALALAAGAGTAGLGGRLRVRVPSGTDTIDAYLSDVLGRDVLISTHLGASRANRKPVLQLLSPRGEAMGFAKISINPLTRDLIRAERDALDTLSGQPFQGLTVPRVLHHGQWQERDVLVLSPLPVWRRRRPLRDGQLAAAMAEVAAVGGGRRGPISGSAYLTGLRQRLAGSAAGADHAGADHAALDAVLNVLTSARGETEVSFGAWHGDWTGWNMACTAESLLVWDWERFAMGVPIGFDALHYRLQNAVVRRRLPPPVAAAECVSGAAATLGPLGVPASEATLTAVLYLADLSTRYLADRQAEAGARLGQPGTWLIPAIEEAVTRL
jgi:hypothetical protein